MATQPDVLLRKLTRREFRRRMQSGELGACIVPVAAIEQHLEHLAMEHDWASTIHVGKAVARRLAPRVLVADALLAGISEHHMRHPGTLSLRPGTFLAVVADLIDSLTRAGFRHIVILNGHGGNIAPYRGVADQMLRLAQDADAARPCNLHFLSYWDVLTTDDARELLKSGVRMPEDLPGHAQEFETAVALAAFPENVRQDAIDDQADRAPALATAAVGREMLERAVTRVTAYIADMLAGRRAVAPPTYMP